MLARAGANGNPNPASVDEIHEALVQGSFGFSVSGFDAQKNSIRISLGKNSAQFVRLPSTDLFGLVEWYGRPKKGKKAAGSAGSADSSDDSDDDEAPEESVIEQVDPEIKEAMS